MLIESVAVLVAASLALAGALGLSIFQRKSEGYHRWQAVSFILDDATEDDLEVLEMFLHLREVELLLSEGSDE